MELTKLRVAIETGVLWGVKLVLVILIVGYVLGLTWTVKQQAAAGAAAADYLTKQIQAGKLPPLGK